jgi:hypothetical protein
MASEERDFTKTPLGKVKTLQLVVTAMVIFKHSLF